MTDEQKKQTDQEANNEEEAPEAGLAFPQTGQVYTDGVTGEEGQDVSRAFDFPELREDDKDDEE